MQTCSTCKFWTHGVREDLDRRVCHHPKLRRGDGHLDGLAGMGTVFTGPKFGCVHYVLATGIAADAVVDAGPKPPEPVEAAESADVKPYPWAALDALREKGEAQLERLRRS